MRSKHADEPLRMTDPQRGEVDKWSLPSEWCRRPPQARRCQAHETRLLAEDEDLEEEPGEGGEVAPPELADRLVVRAGLAREEHEADIGSEALLDPPRAPDPGGIAIEEHLEHHRRVIGRHAPGFLVGSEEGPQVELVDEVADEGRQARRIDPVMQRGRHEEEAVLVVRAERLGAHTRFSRPVRLPGGDYQRSLLAHSPRPDPSHHSSARWRLRTCCYSCRPE
jgi:hypothetical protein